MNNIIKKRLKTSPLCIGLISFIILVLFRIPQKLFGVPYLYTIRYSKRAVANQGERFGITIFEVIAIAIGILLYIIQKDTKIRYMFLLGIIVVTNLMRYAVGLSNPISLESYEAILSFTVALSCGTIGLYCCDSQEKISLLFDILIVIFFASQLYLLATGSGKNGSYRCLGLSGGGAATCYTIYILLRISEGIKNKTEKGLVFCAGIGLLLTGSRTNIILAIIFANLNYLFFAKHSARKKFIIIEALMLITVSAMMFSGVNTKYIGSKKINSLLSVFSTGVSSYVNKDKSAIERTESWRAAFKIIKENPFGISCSIVDLQNRMYGAGSITFPHSTVLANYLLMGIPALCIYFSFWGIMLKSLRYKSKIRILTVYIILILTFYGGISSVYLSFFWWFMIYAYMKKLVNTEEEQFKETIRGTQQKEAFLKSVFQHFLPPKV